VKDTVPVVPPTAAGFKLIPNAHAFNFNSLVPVLFSHKSYVNVFDVELQLLDGPVDIPKVNCVV
jgi:hypothetical protein